MKDTFSKCDESMFFAKSSLCVCVYIYIYIYIYIAVWLLNKIVVVPDLWFVIFHGLKIMEEMFF